MIMITPVICSVTTIPSLIQTAMTVGRESVEKMIAVITELRSLHAVRRKVGDSLDDHGIGILNASNISMFLFVDCYM